MARPAQRRPRVPDLLRQRLVADVRSADTITAHGARPAPCRAPSSATGHPASAPAPGASGAQPRAARCREDRWHGVVSRRSASASSSAGDVAHACAASSFASRLVFGHELLEIAGMAVMRTGVAVFECIARPRAESYSIVSSRRPPVPHRRTARAPRACSASFESEAAPRLRRAARPFSTAGLARHQRRPPPARCGRSLARPAGVRSRAAPVFSPASARRRDIPGRVCARRASRRWSRGVRMTSMTFAARPR